WRLPHSGFRPAWASAWPSSAGSGNYSGIPWGCGFSGNCPGLSQSRLRLRSTREIDFHLFKALEVGLIGGGSERQAPSRFLKVCPEFGVPFLVTYLSGQSPVGYGIFYFLDKLREKRPEPVRVVRAGGKRRVELDFLALAVV